MLERFKRFFMVTEAHLNSASMPTVRQSALRILLSIGLLLILGILLHSAGQNATDQHVHLVITLAFCGFIGAALFFSNKFQFLSSVLLMLTVFAAGVAISIFVQHPDLARLGVIFVYTAPLISLLFFPPWVTFGLVVFNLLPFYLLINRSSYDFFSFTLMDLPHTHEYLHSLLFLFFNVCIPLAILRVLATLKRNATALATANHQLSCSHQLYEDMFENTQIATLLINKEGELLKLNHKACDLLGIAQANAEKLSELLTPAAEDVDAIAPFAAPFEELHPAECYCLKRPGSVVLLTKIGKTESEHLILQLEDLSTVRALHQRLEHKEQEHKILQAYDLLTSLPNVLLFNRLINKRLQRQATGVMAIIRLCNIKSFNQQHGYNAGDELLKCFAHRAREALSGRVQLARLRGVKFIAWGGLASSKENANDFGQALLATLPKQLVMGNQAVMLSYELGLTITEGIATSSEQYIEQCESALEFAEHYHQPIAFYTAAAIAEREAENQLLAELKQALQQQQLVLWLQPKVAAQGQIESFEALLRWEKQPGLFIPPDKIVMLAEKYGFLVQLSSFVLKQATTLLLCWAKHKVPFKLSINLAGPDIMDALFFAELVSLATHQPELVEKLEIELTETSIISKPQQMFEKLTVLKKLGFDIAIDDFGTGQASLSLLAKLPASTLKLDRSFLHGFPEDRLQLKVLQATIQLAKSLNLKLIVEGVETELQQKLLIRLGCEHMQGFLFAKPAAIESWHQQSIFAPYFADRQTLKGLLVEKRQAH